MEPGHLLHSTLTCPLSGNARHHKSRHPFVPAAQLISSSEDNNRSETLSADQRWNAEWLDNTTRLRTFITDIGTHDPRMVLPTTAWVRLKHFAAVSDVSTPAYTNGVMASSAACECGGEEQTVNHDALQCPIQRPLWTTRPDSSGR